MSISSFIPTLIVSENRKDDHQVLEEARDKRGRFATRDVGARRGDNSKSEQKEEGKGIRHLLCPWPCSAASCVSINAYFTALKNLVTVQMLFYCCHSKVKSLIFYISNSALMRKLYKKWRKCRERTSLNASN